MDRIELDYRPSCLNPNPGPVWELDAGDESTEVHEGKFLVGERRKGYFTPEHIFCDAQGGAPLSSNEVEMILIPWSMDTAAIEEAMVHAVQGEYRFAKDTSIEDLCGKIAEMSEIEHGQLNAQLIMRFAYAPGMDFWDAVRLVVTDMWMDQLMRAEGAKKLEVSRQRRPRRRAL